MGTVKTSAIFHYPSGLPSDLAVNTFYFRTAGSTITADELITVEKCVTEFYTLAVGAGDPVSDWFSDYLVEGTDVWQIRTAQFDPATGHETFTERFSQRDLSIPSTATLPLEVAVCLSFNAAPLSLAQKARARGRVYLGPLGGVAVISTTSGPPQVDPNLVEAIRAGAERMLDDSVTGTGGGDPCPWVIWSRADGDTKEVIGGWVDNEFDTQRRRGIGASNRETFGFIV